MEMENNFKLHFLGKWNHNWNKFNLRMLNQWLEGTTERSEGKSCTSAFHDEAEGRGMKGRCARLPRASLGGSTDFLRQ